MPRVSIVIPAFNAEAYIADTLQSVMHSSFDDLEVLVIDDGSRDRTAEIASSFPAPVRVVSQPNAGMSASRNRGIAMSDSEYIALLDSDDVWHPRKLEHQIRALQQRPDHDVCFTRFTPWPGGDAAAFLAEPRQGTVDESMSGWVYHQLILTNWCLPSSMLWRRSAWNQTGPFLCNDQQTDDWEYIIRASRAHRFVRLDESMVLYRQVASSLSRRVPPRNTPELMREELLARYGRHSPDGQAIDEAELAYWSHLGWATFADMHCARGDLRTGLGVFARLLRQGPKRTDSALRVAKSLRRRLFPKTAQTA
jgi:glycosyltransferase involved in cell wall biosynthesis